MRRDTRFKTLIVAVTAASLYLMGMFAWRAPEPPRRAFAKAYARESDDVRYCLDALGLNQRWLVEGNRVAVVSSGAILQPDDKLVHRLRPNTRGVWYHLPLSLFQLPAEQAYILGPDTTEARFAVEAVGGYAVLGSEQTTNSWGWRGPEPDTGAPLKILVVGDSYIQGMLVDDRSTPGAQLQVGLPGSSVLSMGLFAYDTRDYYYCVVEGMALFKPHAVVVNLCVNDTDASWLRKAVQACGDTPCLVTALPLARVLSGESPAGKYPENLRKGVDGTNAIWFDMADVFGRESRGIRDWKKNPLYNGHLNDGHLSASGARLWAQEVAKRLPSATPNTETSWNVRR